MIFSKEGSVIKVFICSLFLISLFAFNIKLKNWYNYLYNEKYKDPNWCQKNVNQLSGKRYDGKTDAQKIEACKSSMRIFQNQFLTASDSKS